MRNTGLVMFTDLSLFVPALRNQLCRTLSACPAANSRAPSLDVAGSPVIDAQPSSILCLLIRQVHINLLSCSGPLSNISASMSTLCLSAYSFRAWRLFITQLQYRRQGSNETMLRVYLGDSTSTLKSRP